MSFLKKLSFILITALALSIAASFIFVSDSPKTEVARALTPANNMFGWAWNDAAGWISFNCVQEYCSDNPAASCTQDSDCGGTCEYDDANCATSDYGVNYGTNNKLDGYAWSSNSGWIYFGQNGGGFPDAPNKWAKVEAGKVVGWAKIINLGDDGWIKLGDDSAPDDWSGQVVLSGQEFSGWAWHNNSNERGLGWISFNCSNDSECGTSDYKVFYNNAPTVSTNAETFSGCGSVAVTLPWSFSDSDYGASQSAYEVELKDSGGADVDLAATFEKISASTGNIIVSGLSLGTYYWRVKVWDNYNLAADWSHTGFYTNWDSFTVPAGAPADFTWGKEDDYSDQDQTYEPRALEDIYFQADAVAGASYAWTFTNAVPAGASGRRPTAIQFQQEGFPIEVTLDVTVGSVTCSETKDLKTHVSLPIWEEVKPE